MTEQKSSEIIKQTTVTLIDFQTPDEALKRYRGLPDTVKGQMAGVYQKAFGGAPWYEQCSCPGCGTYEKGSTCSRCGTTDLPPAYPTDELIGQEFPAMLASFSPGALVLAQNASREVVGFCAGGMTTPAELTVKKYRGNEGIGRSIREQTGLGPDDSFFYENEMCVLPELQGNGVGSALNKARLDWIREQNIGAVLGRTINPNLLKMKEKQFPQRGFAMQTFTPDGDTYQVDGLQRQCYFAVRVK